MTASNEFLEKLKNSRAVTSLNLEFDVATTIRKFGWTVAHGAYYRDPIEKKLRELDVRATQILIRGEEQKGLKFDFLCRIRLLVQCKTIRGYHLVFPPAFPTGSPIDDCLLPYYWIGNDDKIRSRLRDLLIARGLQSHYVDHVRDCLAGISHPDHLAVTQEVMPAPLPSPFLASTFAETNTEKDKDIENSVLWHAALSLQSAVQSLETRIHETSWSNSAELLEAKADVDEKEVKGLLASYRRETRMFDIWHPIVVVCSELWSFKDNEMTPVDWVRLMHIEEAGWSSDSWCDVVRFDTREKYFEQLTKHYLEFFTRHGFVARVS